MVGTFCKTRNEYPVLPSPKVVTALLAMEARKPHMIVSQNIKWAS